MIIEELRVALNISEEDDSLDEKVEGLYALVKKIFTQLTRVELSEATHIDIFTNFDSTKAFLHSGPVVSITRVEATSTFGSTAELITEFQAINDTLFFKSNINAFKLVVEYVAGFSNIPEEIDQILIKMLSYLWKYDDNKIMISTGGEAILAPKDIQFPKVIYDAIAIYRIGI